MARLAEIKDARSKEPGQPIKTVHVNPANVTTVEEIEGSTKISTNDGHSFQTSVGMDAVVLISQSGDVVTICFPYKVARKFLV